MRKRVELLEGVRVERGERRFEVWESMKEGMFGRRLAAEAGPDPHARVVSPVGHAEQLKRCDEVSGTSLPLSD